LDCLNLEEEEKILDISKLIGWWVIGFIAEVQVCIRVILRKESKLLLLQELLPATKTKDC